MFVSAAVLHPGDVLGERYEILQLLGEGGMGAVYKARDHELDRFVALKLIRPELASNPGILVRFKQELLLAHQVTHRNVIRIYDLAEAERVKFITMEFIEGMDLRRLLLDRGKVPPEEAVEVIRQVCLALDAAHSVGVIHRDLKPQNIMRDQNGRIVVMDFGLARSIESEGMTQTGALVGTMEYMSPEQSLGQELDQRSDLFALGLIFFELLTGNTPYRAETALASLLKRNRERAIPAVDLNPNVPRRLSDIVSKCLERDVNLRYGSVQEILRDLEVWKSIRPAAESSTIPPPGTRTAPYWKWTSGALALFLIVAVVVFRLENAKPKPTHPPVSVLVADFTNHTGDPIFEDTLEPMFNVALEGASFINAFSRGDARKLAQKLPHPTDKLDEQSARLIALSQGLGGVVTGSLSRRADGYKLSVEALDTVSGKTIASADVSASNKDELLLALPKLAAPIRAALGDTTPESVQLAAAAGTFTAASLETVHQYGVAMEEQFAGKTEDALRSFSKAAELDPNFARAYSGMAAMARNLGRRDEAEKDIKLAIQHFDRMTERERYHTRAFYYALIGDYQKCADEYGTLVNQYPADNIGYNNLAYCAVQLRNMGTAAEVMRRAVEVSPKAAMQRMNLAVIASYAGDFQTGEREARAAQQLNPSYEKGYLALAYAQLGQGQLPQAAETYQQLEKLSARGASFAAAGLADLALYEGRFADAARILEKGATEDLSAKRPERAADKFAMLAYTEVLREQKQAAAAAAEKALANSNSVKIRFLAARIFIEAGEAAKAGKIAAGLASEVKTEPQTYAKLLAGEAALKEGNSRKAIQVFTEANSQLDTWISRFDLGRTDLEAGLFTEADSEFDRCIKRRGEALELFMDDMPTYGYVPPAYYYQGRVREALKSAGFADFYRTYLSIRGKTGEDPLLAEVRRRASQ